MMLLYFCYDFLSGHEENNSARPFIQQVSTCLKEMAHNSDIGKILTKVNITVQCYRLMRITYI